MTIHRERSGKNGKVINLSKLSMIAGHARTGCPTNVIGMSTITIAPTRRPVGTEGPKVEQVKKVNNYCDSRV